MSPHEVGRWGEARAQRYLERHGWTVLARNYRFGRREIDLVVRKGRTLAFVEVKTRRGPGFGAPAEAVTARKRHEIEAVATHWMECRSPGDVLVRFDVVGIILDPSTGRVEIEHVEDAWRPGWG